MDNISRGPTFRDFVTIRTEASKKNATVARQSTRVQTPLSPLNVLRESLFVDSQNFFCATLKRRGSWVISVYLWIKSSIRTAGGRRDTRPSTHRSSWRRRWCKRWPSSPSSTTSCIRSAAVFFISSSVTRVADPDPQKSKAASGFVSESLFRSYEGSKRSCGGSKNGAMAARGRSQWRRTGGSKWSRRPVVAFCWSRWGLNGGGRGDQEKI